MNKYCMFKTYIFAYFIGLNLMLLKTAQAIYEFKSAQYGNTGCGVFKRGVQN